MRFRATAATADGQGNHVQTSGCRYLFTKLAKQGFSLRAVPGSVYSY
jgi:hypothetical protein